jgi:hypothetical protein
MPDFSKSRKSTNIEDWRGLTDAQKAARSMGEAIQRQIDRTMVLKAEVSGYNSQQARSMETDLSKDLDSFGTKGKGRLGGGRSYQNTLQRTINRMPPRVKFK